MWGKNVWSTDTKIKAVIYLILISGKITISVDLDLTELIHYDKGNVAA